jgi:hypothetical protein
MTPVEQFKYSLRYHEKYALKRVDVGMSICEVVQRNGMPSNQTSLKSSGYNALEWTYEEYGGQMHLITMVPKAGMWVVESVIW